MQEEAIRVETHQIKEGTPFYNWAMKDSSKINTVVGQSLRRRK